MTRTYSKVTVVGSARRIDLVLPADETVGVLTADLIRILDEPASAPPLPRYLTTASGDVLPADATLAQAAVDDGAVLRLVGGTQLPPTPLVYDVAEQTAAVRDGNRWRVTGTYRRVLGAGRAGSGGRWASYSWSRPRRRHCWPAGVPVARASAVPLPEGGLDRRAAVRTLSVHGVHVVELPYDRHLAAGAPIDLARLGQATEDATVQIGAEILLRSTWS